MYLCSKISITDPETLDSDENGKKCIMQNQENKRVHETMKHVQNTTSYNTYLSNVKKSFQFCRTEGPCTIQFLHEIQTSLKHGFICGF